MYFTRRYYFLELILTRIKIVSPQKVLEYFNVNYDNATAILLCNGNIPAHMFRIMLGLILEDMQLNKDTYPWTKV